VTNSSSTGNRERDKGRCRKRSFAKALSWLGHPGAGLPVIVILLLRRTDAPSLTKSIIPILILAASVLAFVLWQVHRRRWKDVDASLPRERRSLNRFLVVGLGCAGLATTGRSFHPGLSLGFAISCLQVLIAMAASRSLKLSMHAAFDAFCSLLVKPFGPWAVAAGLAITAGVCWSRVALSRHTVPEVLGGAVLGLSGGVLFWFLLGL